MNRWTLFSQFLEAFYGHRGRPGARGGSTSQLTGPAKIIQRVVAGYMPPGFRSPRRRGRRVRAQANEGEEAGTSAGAKKGWLARKRGKMQNIQFTQYCRNPACKQHGPGFAWRQRGKPAGCRVCGSPNIQRVSAQNFDVLFPQGVPGGRESVVTFNVSEPSEEAGEEEQ